MLGLHLPVGHRTGVFKQAVGQGALAMVNVGNDAEVADVRLVHRVPCPIPA